MGKDNMNKLPINLGKNNNQWKENPGMSALHDWVKRHLVKPQTCRDCNQPKPLDLANISQEYKRDLSDWEWLCRKCHMAKDGRSSRLRFTGKHTKEARLKMSKALKGKPKSEEWKSKMRGKNNPNYKTGLHVKRYDWNKDRKI